MGKITIKTRGKVFGGWKKAGIKARLDHAASEWDLDASEAWAGHGRADRPAAGDLVEVFYDGELITTGYIEQDDESEDATSHTVTFGGRAKPGDVVDSTAPPGVHQNVTLGQLARIWCEPFGVGVLVEVDSPIVARWRANPGETIVGSLQRLAAQHQIIVTDTPDGRVRIMQAGRVMSGGAIVYGENTKKHQRSIDLSQRFRAYECRGQSTTEGKAITDLKATVVDGIFPASRPRRMAIKADSTGGGDGPKRSVSDRIRVEAARRAGQSITFTYVMNGWQHQGGRLWRTGELVPVTDVRFNLIREPLLVVALSATLDDSGGELATLELAPPIGWAPIPIDVPTVPRERRAGQSKDTSVPTWNIDAFETFFLDPSQRFIYGLLPDGKAVPLVDVREGILSPSQPKPPPERAP